MKRLLAPDGCPWDREQTMDSLKPFLIEEAYEVLEAMDGPAGEHCEELGDLLMQVVFQAELRQAEGAFGIDDAIGAIVAKLIRRHPHIFTDAGQLDTSDEVLTQWAEIKAAERAAKGETDRPASVLSGVPRAMPALSRAHQLTARAAQVGFDWPEPSGPREKIDEELAELDQAIVQDDPAQIAAELGDLLFAAVNLARKHGIDPEGALRGAIERFTSRFAHMEDRLRQQGRGPSDATLQELDQLWGEAKRDLLRNSE